MIRAVFLDVDDTLVDYDFAARNSFRAALGTAGDYDRFMALDHHDRFLRGELNFTDMRHTRMRDYLTMLGRDDDPMELEQLRYEGLAAHYRLFEDALPSVQALRQRGLLLGLITNNESKHQRAKIAAVGLDELFDAIIISAEFGVAKPDPRIFAHACRVIGVEPHEAMHVGDNSVADAEGAHAAGMRAVWLDRAGSHDGSPLDYETIGALHELEALLGAPPDRDLGGPWPVR
jgi:putative hydrolase of the HAD superfamily